MGKGWYGVCYGEGMRERDDMFDIDEKMREFRAGIGDSGEMPTSFATPLTTPLVKIAHTLAQQGRNGELNSPGPQTPSGE